MNFQQEIGLASERRWLCGGKYIPKCCGMNLCGRRVFALTIQRFIVLFTFQCGGNRQEQQHRLGQQIWHSNAICVYSAEQLMVIRVRIKRYNNND